MWGLVHRTLLERWLVPRDAPLTRLPGRWYELRVTVPREQEDPLVALMHADGAIGARTRPAGPSRVQLSAWFDRRETASVAVRRLDALSWADLAEPALREITDPGWLESSEERREPLLAGRFIVVESTPDEEEAQTGRTPSDENRLIRVVIPRGRAFGTGEHETTRLCLEALSDAERVTGGAVVDLGTGSGILGIAAALDGRIPVTAIDNDANVLDVALDNARENGVERDVTVRRGSWSDLPREPRLGLLLANIHRTTLVRAARRGVASLRAGGRAIVSGFPPGDAPLVERAWLDAGAVAAGVRTRGAWSALEFVRLV